MSNTPELVEVDDPVYQQTVHLVAGFGRFRVARLQQMFRIGYNRASRIMDRLKEAGLIVPVEAEGGGYYEPAPKPAPVEPVGKFGHHPESAIDFMLEVEAIENELVDLASGLQPTMDLPARAAVALEFRVGGDAGAVAAKNALRARVAEHAAARQEGTKQGEGAAMLNPLDLVALARETGLRNFLHGLSATDARVLLGRYLVAIDAARAAGATEDAVLAEAKRLHAASALAADPESPASWDSLCGPAQASWVLRVKR